MGIRPVDPNAGLLAADQAARTDQARKKEDAKTAADAARKREAPATPEVDRAELSQDHLHPVRDEDDEARKKRRRAAKDGDEPDAAKPGAPLKGNFLDITE